VRDIGIATERLEKAVSTVELPKSIPFQPVRLSVERYHALTKAGAFCEHDAVELLDGVVVEKMSKNPAHRLATRKCELLLSQLCPESWHVQNQEPITLQTSEPEPDIAVVRGKMEDYASRHPSLDEIALVVEVADTSLVTDRYKAEISARAEIPVYWLVNLVDRRIEVMTEPRVVGDLASYGCCKIVDLGDRLEFMVNGMLVGTLAVNDLLGVSVRRTTS
jgi:Uma2 family endonuclease